MLWDQLLNPLIVKDRIKQDPFLVKKCNPRNFFRGFFIVKIFSYISIDEKDMFTM